MKSLAPFLVMIAILIAIAIIIVVLSNNNVKKRILEKGPLNDAALQALNQISGYDSEMLKWGLIVLFGGMGLVLLEFIPYNVDASPLPYGVEAIFVSVGFLTYYFLMKHKK